MVTAPISSKPPPIRQGRLNGMPREQLPPASVLLRLPSFAQLHARLPAAPMTERASPQLGELPLRCEPPGSSPAAPSGDSARDAQVPATDGDVRRSLCHRQAGTPVLQRSHGPPAILQISDDSSGGPTNSRQQARPRQAAQGSARFLVPIRERLPVLPRTRALLQPS